MITSAVLFEKFLESTKMTYEVDMSKEDFMRYIVRHENGITVAAFDSTGEFIDIVGVPLPESR